MRLFDNYLDGLDGVLSKKVAVTPSMLREQRGFSQKIQKSNMLGSINESVNDQPVPLDGPKVMFTYDKNFIEKHFGLNSHSFNAITIGAHPDFLDIDDTTYVNHHCVSVFIDIKGSTRLIEKYTLLEVRLIKDSLLTLAINVANQFGGHVHRLQGDGIFLQFVRRNQSKNDAIVNALNATSLLAQFVSVDLAKIMEQYDIRPLKIRVGIDYGDDEKVLWSYYGIPGCGELTTTSLHTDMAAKLQSKADENSILIGGNVKDALDLKPDFFSIYESASTKEKVYYISKQYTYPFYVFNWKEYLLSFPFVSKTSDGKTLEIKEKTTTIECFISNDDGSNSEQYFPNSKSIPKGKKIIYVLKRGNTPFLKQSFEKIEWHAHNSGKEAADLQLSKHDFGKKYDNNNRCETGAAYLGHHHVECKIIREHSTTERITFPIFVQ